MTEREELKDVLFIFDPRFLFTVALHKEIIVDDISERKCQKANVFAHEVCMLSEDRKAKRCYQFVVIIRVSSTQCAITQVKFCSDQLKTPLLFLLDYAADLF